MWLRLAWFSLCRSRWLGTFGNPPASASQILGSQMNTPIPSCMYSGMAKEHSGGLLSHITSLSCLASCPDFSDQDPGRAPSEQGCARGAARNPQLAPLPKTRMLFSSHLLPMITLTCGDQDLKDVFVGIKQLILFNVDEKACVDIIY